MTKRHSLIASAAAGVFGIMSLSAIAAAQSVGPGWGELMTGPGMMMGPGVMGPGRRSRVCSPSTAGFAQWNIGRIERLIKLTDAQRIKLDETKAASDKALDTLRTACPAEFPTTTVGRMAAMEQRLEAMLTAVKTMRPAIDAFYATLNDEQKARLDSNAGAGRFWRWRDPR